MGRQGKREYMQAIRARYQRAGRQEQGQILTEFCAVCGYHRKSAIRVLRARERAAPRRRRRGRRPRYGPQAISIVAAVWAAAGYPWSVRLKATVALWLPWIRQRFAPDEGVVTQLLAISPRQLDRRLQARRRARQCRAGRTRPGRLVSAIPLRTARWDTTTPGDVEVDLVAHSGLGASPECVYSLNLTDLATGWVATRAVQGKGQHGIVTALDTIRRSLPFPLRCLTTDNGSEFLNAHLQTYCAAQGIAFTRTRPYHKDDNPHVEQKNWTHVRQLTGYARYASAAAAAALNALYTQEWGWLQNLCLPSVQLRAKVRHGARVTRRHDAPQTPWQRVLASGVGTPEQLAPWHHLAATLDPFVLAAAIERKATQLAALAEPTGRGAATPRRPRALPSKSPDLGNISDGATRPGFGSSF